MMYSIRFGRLGIWVALEITLMCLGVDDIADISEFLFEKPVFVVSQVYAIE